MQQTTQYMQSRGNKWKHVVKTSPNNAGSKSRSPRVRLGDYLAKECQELFRHEDIGVVTETRPHVRLVNQEHIDKLSYAKALQHRSNGTLEGTARSYLTTNMEQTVDNQPPEVTIQSNPSRKVARMASNGIRQLSAISSGLRQQHKTFASIERLKAFRNTERNKHSQQPYAQKECKFELNRTGQTL